MEYYQANKYIAVLLVILFSAAGCSRSLNEFDIVGYDAEFSPRFSGIRALFDEHNYDNVNILLVHGMGGYAADRNGKSDDVTLPEYISNELNFHKKIDYRRVYIRYPASKPIKLKQSDKKHSKRDKKIGIGYLESDKYSRSDGKFLTIYTLNWQKSVENDKFYLNIIDKQQWIEKLRLADYTDSAKRVLMNTLVSDALLYTGKKRNQINSAFVQSANFIQTNSVKTNHANVIISFSLGSAIVSDALELTRTKLISQFKNNLCKVYFLANQIPLLELGVDSNRKNSRKAYSPYIESGAILPKCRRNENSPWVISISDPNDLLSYPIDKKIREHRMFKNTFADVAISIANRAYWASIWFVNPIDAHTLYGSNKSVKNMIVNGYTSKNR